MKHSIVFIVLASLFCACDSPPKSPTLDGVVTDRFGVLPTSTKDRMTATLRAYEKETCHQVAILIIKSTNGEPIEQFSLSVANRAGIGQRGLNNGVLVTVAIDDRRMRIEVGHGMTKYITDEDASRIVQTDMAGDFKTGNYVSGIERGVQAIMVAARQFVVPNDQRPSVCKRA